MTYKLKFHPDALEEWESLSQIDKDFLKKKLEQRLENPISQSLDYLVVATSIR